MKMLKDMSYNLPLLPFLFLFTLNILIYTEAKIGPKGMEDNETTTCEEFSKFARFNPHSVLQDIWFVFYYWAPPIPKMTYTFTIPTINETRYLHYLLDQHVETAVNWTAKQILMKDKYNYTSLLIERSDRGHYWLYLLYEEVRKGTKLKPIDVRLKQTGDNKYVAMVACEGKTAIVMSRIKDVPPKVKLQDEAARIGYRGRGGKSYLYQGHQWMPVPEADDQRFWTVPSARRRFMYD